MAKTATKNATTKELAVVPEKIAALFVGLPEDDDFDSLEHGEIFGTDYDRLEMEVGETTGFLAYVKKTTVSVGEGEEKKALDIHVAIDNTSKEWSLPIGAIFWNRVKEADLKQGDVFRIRRNEDILQTKGKGKGQYMKNFSIKVYQRSK